MGACDNRDKNMGIINQKKSIFYTATAIALAAIVFISYNAYSIYTLNNKMDVVQTRIESVNFFIKDVEKDLEKGFYIASFRTLLSLNQFIATNGSYIDNVSQRFTESFLNGTINNKMMTLMIASTFTDWANKIAIEADKTDILFSFTVNDVTLSQSSPWYVDIGLNLSLDIRDKRNTSYWIRDRNLINRMSIIGFEDPTYIVGTSGRVSNVITETKVGQFVIGGNASNLVIHANNSYYVAHNDSPSYLMRFEGIFNASPSGIESLVNVEELQAQGISALDRSIVDFIYFGTKATTDYRINNTPDWFKIDQEHLDFYGVTNITV